MENTISAIFTVYVEIDAETNVAVYESWVNDEGDAHRIGGPAIIARDRESGVAINEVWHENDVPHRNRYEGPAVTNRDGKTGEVTLVQYYENGELLSHFSDDWPAPP